MIKKYTHRQILQFFMMDKYAVIKVLIPNIIRKKIEYIYLMVYRNSVEYTTIINFIFLLGVDVFYKLVSVGKIKSFVEMMKVAKYIKSSVIDYVINCSNDDVLLPMDLWHYLNSQFQRRDFTAKDINNFNRFVKDNKYNLIDDVILLNQDTIDYLFQNYENSKVKQKKLY